MTAVTATVVLGAWLAFRVVISGKVGRRYSDIEAGAYTVALLLLLPSEPEPGRGSMSIVTAADLNPVKQCPQIEHYHRQQDQLSARPCFTMPNPREIIGLDIKSVIDDHWSIVCSPF